MADAPPYVVVDQERDTAVGTNGKIERGWRIYFVPKGMTNPADVFVADSDYSEANVRTLLDHEVARITAVHNIGK